jgi:hypothetical protein
MSAARSAATGLMWLITTVLLAAALPAMWVQTNLVDRGGYAALSQRAAGDPQLQSAIATELTAQVGRLSPTADSTVVSAIAKTYTASSSFPPQFAQAGAFAHRWLFADWGGSGVDPGVDQQGRWVIDFAPMLSDAAFAQTLRDYSITVPTALPIPFTDTAPAALRPGALRSYGMWMPWVGWGLAALTAAAALLTLYVAARRGKTLAALGVSALLVGAAGWGGIEFGRRYTRAALDDNTSGNLRRVADGMVVAAQNSMHQWLNLTLVIGGGLVIVGVIVSLLASLSKHPMQK